MANQMKGRSGGSGMYGLRALALMLGLFFLFNGLLKVPLPRGPFGF